MSCVSKKSSSLPCETTMHYPSSTAKSRLQRQLAVSATMPVTWMMPSAEVAKYAWDKPIGIGGKGGQR